MRTSLILAAAVAALAASGGAIAQNRLPEHLGNPNLAPDNADTFRGLEQYDFEFYRSGAYNDQIIRQESGGRCWMRYLAIDTDTGASRYGAPVEMPCSMTIAQAVATDSNKESGIVTLAQLRATVGEGPAAGLPQIAAVTPRATEVSARVPVYTLAPASWQGPDAWAAHQQACDERYRTFNPGTDTYYDAPGHRRFCNKGLKPLG